MLSAGTFCLCAVLIEYPHNSKRASLVPLLKSCSRRRKPSTNFWFTGLTYAHYIAMIWKKAGENHPRLPAPAAFGWTFDAGSNHFSPVRCLNPPAPEAIMHLIKCGCKSGCEGRCSCRKNNIPCTEFCGCWIFTYNNKSRQPGINEECEDV